MPQISPRIHAIRKNVAHLDQHMQEFASACENICDALDTLEDTALLKKVFLQIIASIQELSDYTQKNNDQFVGELEELILITKIDNSINVQLRRIEELMTNIQKIFSTWQLWQAVGFALIQQEIARIHRSRRQSTEIYHTIKAHYIDEEGIITDFLESTSSQSSQGKILHQALKNKHILWK